MRCTCSSRSAHPEMTYSQLQADILNYKIYSRRRRAVDIAHGRYCVRSREEPVATAAKRKWNETADAASVVLHRRAEFLMLDNTESTTISSADTHLRRNRVELKHVQKGHDWWWCQRILGTVQTNFKLAFRKMPELIRSIPFLIKDVSVYLCSTSLGLVLSAVDLNKSSVELQNWCPIERF